MDNLEKQLDLLKTIKKELEEKGKKDSDLYKKVKKAIKLNPFKRRNSGFNYFH